MTEDEIRRLENPGLPPEEWSVFIEETVREHASLDQLKCPKCGATLTRSLDSRQAGPSSLGPGYVWFNYVCHTCPWFADRKERE